MLRARLSQKLSGFRGVSLDHLPQIPLHRLLAPILALALLFLLTARENGKELMSNVSLELLFQMRGPVPPPQDIVLVVVDEDSIATYGQWPFPRSLHARLLRQLAGAKAVGFDFLFSEASRNPQDDADFSAALQAGPPTVLAALRQRRSQSPQPGAMQQPAASLHGYRALGHIAIAVQPGGLLRKVNLTPSVGAPAMAVSLAAVAGVETPHYAKPQFVNFYGDGGNFQSLSYKEVLEGAVPPDLFKDRYVLIGTRARGLGDFHVTVFTHYRPTPGVELQATILGNLLNASFIRQMPGLTPMLIGLFILLPLFVWPLLSERYNALLNLTLALALLGCALTLFTYRNCAFDWLGPIQFLFFSYLFYLLLEVFNATRYILHQIRVLDHLLDERLYRILDDSPDQVDQNGQARTKLQAWAESARFFSVQAGQNGQPQLRARRVLFSSAGIQGLLRRLHTAVDAMRLQHHFLDNLLNRELPPLMLWDSRTGQPIFSNVAFRDLWQACCGKQSEALPDFNEFVALALELSGKNAGNRDPAAEGQVRFDLAEGQIRFDLQVRLPSGQRDFQGSIQPIAAPGTDFAGSLALLQDVTEIKELERVKDEVVSIVSHELKQPLTVILGYGQMLAEGLNGPNQVFAQKICGQAERLNRMIRDFLDIARLESGRQQIRRQPFPLDRLVTEALETVQPSAAQKGIQVQAETPDSAAPYNGDESLLAHALLNLLDNAVKFSAPGTAVTVRVREEADRFVVQVADQGPGIPDEERERVFGKFQRGSRTAKDEGFGLGLHLVHQIIEGHGGTIVALAVPKGATFEIVLPKEGGSATTPPSPEA